MKKIFIACIALWLMPVLLSAQRMDLNKLDSLSGKIIRQLQAQDKNKIWLVTDRDIYAAGETIYYKAWIVDSVRNHIQKLPKKLYIDLVNDSDKVLHQSLLNNGLLKTDGSLHISDWTPGGNYWLRAYTYPTSGAKAELLCVVPLYILNIHLPAEANIATADSAGKVIQTNPSIHLFPEGGNFISGLISMVAVKAVDEEGKPWVTTLKLKDNRDTTLTTFTTNAQGLGRFSFYPKWFYTYTLQLPTSSHKDSVVTRLPPVNFFAAQLSLEKQTDDYITARIALEDSIYRRDAVTYILGISKDSLCFVSQGNGIYNVTIPTGAFPGGVARLLLFNDKQQLLSEREVYIHKQDVNIVVAANKDKYGGRENVRLSIQIKNAAGLPLSASLAIAVTDSHIDDSLAQEIDRDSLCELPPAAADLILLTQENKSANPIAASLSATEKKEGYDDSTFLVSGKVIDKKGIPLGKRVVTILSGKKMFFLQTDTTLSNGSFHFSLSDFADSTEFSLQISNLKGRRDEESNIRFDTVIQPHIITPESLKKKIFLGTAQQNVRTKFISNNSFLAGTGKDYLAPVVVTTFKKKELTYDASKRVSNFSHIITQEMIGSGAETAGNALLMIPGVHLSQGLVMIGGPSSFKPSATNEPIIILDGARVDLNATDSTLSSPVLNFLNSLSFRTIDFIEVLTGAEAAIYGVSGGNGVILINTKTGGVSNVNSKGLLAYYPQGFHEAKPFPMPDYNNSAIKKSKAVDARITLYWNGNLYTDKEGKATVSFFTADAANAYTVTVTAITTNGCVLQKKFLINR